MNGRSVLTGILLTATCAFLLAPRSQSQSAKNYPTRCEPTFRASDEFKELIGLKVYPRIVLDEVKIDGVTQLPDASRDQLIASIEEREFDDEPNWVAGPEQQVREFWRDRGYFKVRVTSNAKILAPDAARRHAAVAFHVEEGPQYKLKNIRFQNSDPEVPLMFPPEQLRKLIPLRDGEIFSTKAIRDGLEAFKQLYDSRGYVDFTSTPITDIDDASNEISLIFQMDQERQFYIAKFDFLGDCPQAEKIVRSRIKVGDIFNDRDIEDFYDQNKSLLPAGASPRDSIATRNQRSGTVDLTFDFRDCLD